MLENQGLAPKQWGLGSDDFPVHFQVIFQGVHILWVDLRRAARHT